MSIHNPHNLKKGDIVRLDKGKANSSLVQIISLSEPAAMFCCVRGYNIDKGSFPEWDVMTNRLTPKE